MTSLLTAGVVLRNRYKIIRLLGQGNMGAVYLGEDQLSGQFVALKENSDPSQDALDQFTREAVMLARLQHRGLPHVTDHFIEASGRQYLVMTYVEGENFQEILARRRSLSEAEVLAWMKQVFDAVEYMHTWVDPVSGKCSPVIHRDIKPANIKLTPDGRVVLVDFGIAKYQAGSGTATGARGVGTPGFAPVEQYTGGTDVRSDVYALGATLYCLVTGQAPPESPAIAAGTPLIPPRVLNPTISPKTEQVITRAMQIQAKNRYQEVRDLWQALTHPAMVQIPQRQCAVCGATNKAAAHFCLSCGASLSPIPTFEAKPVAIWSAGLGFVGMMLGYLPKLVVRGGTNPLLEAGIYAGMLLFGAVGAVMGAFTAQKVSVDAPDFLPKLVVTFITTIALEIALGPVMGAFLIRGGTGPAVRLLAFLGSVGGALAGIRFTQSEVFRRIKWG